MSFELQGSGGNCTDCQWVQASGTIEADTADKFRLFHAEFGCHARVYLDSPGGNLLGGLALGEAFRELGCITGVGTSASYEDTHASTEEPGTCLSACVYALMGGPHRAASEEDKVGIHQHYLRTALESPDAKQFDARSLSANQVLTGLLVAYTMSMGVDPLVVALASQVPPDEPIMLLDMESLALLRVITNHWRPAEWTLQVYGDGLYASVLQPQENRALTAEAGYFCETRRESTAGYLRLVFPVNRKTEPFESVCALDSGEFKLYLNWNDTRQNLADHRVSIDPVNCEWQRDTEGGWTVVVALPLSDANRATISRFGSFTTWWGPRMYIDITLREFSLAGFGDAARLARRNCIR